MCDRLDRGNLSTLDCYNGVVRVEEEGDSKVFQFKEHWLSSRVKYEDELESTGPCDGLSSDSRDWVTLVFPWDGEREW